MRRNDRPLASESGFTITELLVSTALMLTVVAGIFTVLNPAQGTFQAQPEVSDMQQRMRVAVDTLNKDLVMAGAGTYSGAMAQGALTNFFSAVYPYRVGLTSPDPPGIFKSDTITLLYVPDTAAQTTISQSMPPTSNELKVNPEPGCPKGDDLCGFYEGMTVIIYDESGAWNTFVVTNVQGSAGHLQRHGPDFQKSYDSGAHVTQVTTQSYYLKTDDATQTYQLMHYDGGSVDMPVADNVVALTFEYFGDPQPPTLYLEGGVTRSTYGPRPPLLGADGGTGYPAGENCLFGVVNGQQVSRLPDLQPGNIGLVPLTAGMLTDGPWCPNPASNGRFDADLFRVRQIRVRIRIQAGIKALRGTGALFTKAGYARGGEMFVPDQELRFDVAPRNMNLGR